MRARQFPGAILMVAADDTCGKLAGVLGGTPIDLRVARPGTAGGLPLRFSFQPGIRAWDQPDYLPAPAGGHASAPRDRGGVPVASIYNAAADYHAATRWYQDYDFWPILADPSILQPTADRHPRAGIACAGASQKIWGSTVDYERIVIAAPRIYDLARPLADAVRHVFPVPRIPPGSASPCAPGISTTFACPVNRGNYNPCSPRRTRFTYGLIE